MQWKCDCPTSPINHSKHLTVHSYCHVPSSTTSKSVVVVLLLSTFHHSPLPWQRAKLVWHSMYQTMLYSPVYCNCYQSCIEFGIEDPKITKKSSKTLSQKSPSPRFWHKELEGHWPLDSTKIEVLDRPLEFQSIRLNSDICIDNTEIAR